MKPAVRLIILAVVAAGFILSFSQPAAAQAKPTNNQVIINSFTGIYHLQRDSRGLSLLTTEETIVADFPASGFYGIKRVIPKKFQSHSVNIKILNVSDAASNPVPYKTASDSNNNLVITTGNPAITLVGSQTIKIRYLTSGVINLSQKTDEFLLNVNGRGWEQPIGRVSATLYVPVDFKASLKTTPSCYLALGNLTSDQCQISSQKSAQATITTAKASSLAAHQALVLRLDFATSTFTNKHALSKSWLLVLAIAFVLLSAMAAYRYLRKR